MNGNLNQPITLPSFGQIVYQNSGVPGVFNPVPIQQTITLPIPVPNNFDANKRGQMVTIHPNKKSFTRKDNTLVSYNDYEVKPVSM